MKPHLVRGAKRLAGGTADVLKEWSEYQAMMKDDINEKD